VTCPNGSSRGGDPPGDSNRVNAAAARHFERVAPTYTALRGRGPNGLLRRQEQRAVAALAAIAPGARVLDAGCGDGETMAWAEGLGARAFGFDLVRSMAGHCRTRGFDVCVQDMESPGFRPVLDWVLCVGSMEFTSDPQRAMHGFSGCLEPGGRLLLLFPRRGLLGHLYRLYHRAHGVPIHVFSHAEISLLLSRAGFQPLRWRRCVLASVCLARKVGAPA
jgi:SAM-dependent methyltransferase